MDKFGCVLEMMFGNIMFGQQSGGHLVQAEQVYELEKLGLECYVNGQSEEAIKYFKQAIKVCPRADVYNDLGLVYINLGEYAKAINSFKSALSLDDSYLPAFYNLGITFHYAKAYDIAVDVFEQIIKSSDGLEKDVLVRTYSDMACSKSRKGDDAGAIESIKNGLEVDENFVSLHANLGNMNLSKSDFEAAKAEYDRAIAIDPKCAAAYNGLGVVALENGEFEKAKEFFTKALSIDSECNASNINLKLLEKVANKAKA